RVWAVLLACVLCVATLAACSTDKLVPKDEAPADKSITLTSAEYAEGNIHIRYPQVEGLADESKQNALNQLLKTEVWNATAKEAIETYSAEKVTLDVHYTVTLHTENLLSVLYTGRVHIEGGVHENNVLYAETVDLQSGEKLSLSHFVAANEDFAKQIMQEGTVTTHDGKAWTGQSLWEAGGPRTAGELLQGFRESRGYYTFHLTKEALVLSVPVPEAGGGYAFVTLVGDYATRPEPADMMYYTLPFTLSTVSDEFMAVSDLAYVYKDENAEDGWWNLRLSTRQAVTGLQFIEVDESEVTTAGKVLYEVESLNAGEAVYITTYLNDTTANRGISFLDVWGQRRYYTIEVSMKDGSLSLKEFGNDRVGEKNRLLADREAGEADAFEIDISFDGQPDLLIARERPAAGVCFTAYVWDATEWCYWPADDWTLTNFVLDTEHQRILSYNAGDMHTIYSISYWDAETRELVREHTLFWGWYTIVENGPLAEKMEFMEYKNGDELVVSYPLTEWEDVYTLDKTDPRFAPYFEPGSLWDLDNEKWRDFALAGEFYTYPSADGPMDLSEETAAFLYGTWEVKGPAIFGTSWKEDSDTPTGPDIVGKHIVMRADRFSTDALEGYPAYQVSVDAPTYTVAEIFYDTDEFFRVWKVDLPEVQWHDMIRVIKVEGTGPQDFLFLSVNNQRLFFLMESAFFELTRVE
ncbi:MAG: hypothetical protein J6R77_05735, partial [Clostridia bacterium]|nr:hypothetical protein [Clostridia bacterium]